MERERLDRSNELRGRAATLLLLVVAALVSWTLLQSFGTRSGPRHAPSQAPAGQEPMHRATPTFDQDLMG
jgi:hypothetical protein